MPEGTRYRSPVHHRTDVRDPDAYACSCRDRSIEGRNDSRAPPSQEFAGRRKNRDSAGWGRPTDHPTDRWQDKSREVRGGRLAGKRAMIKDLARCAPAHESLPVRTSHCK
jgi:hypothetical protein